MEGEIVRINKICDNSIFFAGWNDPPKNVGPPTGNLKINLNKRVAFPQTPPSSSQQAAPLLLPPKQPSVEFITPEASDPSKSDSSNVDFTLEKENVLRNLSAGIEKLSASVKTSAANKLKSLESDWTACDSEVQSLLVELVKCMK